ncbi:unnamed protein product [Fraxinus pennsylvanica]|uniref:LRR receptor-like serine/threonine-protein kinase n=1 Tax=Fraxinus pennsylvanica TaxID=56036 RepID=A0AAD1YU62_9LAMI|nr:unnamed protein product [Fraxinus pennsylvanica]
MFERWGILANDQWNISGELCIGVAIDNDTPIQNFNPGIKYDCSYRNATTCHIIALRVYALNVVSPIPDELWNLTFLTDVNLAKNYLTGPLPPSIGDLVRMQYLTQSSQLPVQWFRSLRYNRRLGVYTPPVQHKTSFLRVSDIADVGSIVCINECPTGTSFDTRHT